jgi:DNA polymerase
MYHPAAALHQQTLRETIKTDMLKIPALLAEAQKAPEPKTADQPQQLSLL